MYTPKGWEVAVGDDYLVVYKPAFPNESILPYIIAKIPKTEENAEANAHFIAAAPDLLKAARQLAYKIINDLPRAYYMRLEKEAVILEIAILKAGNPPPKGEITSWETET